MSNKKSGILVRHEDGRKGIAYHKDQQLTKDEKVVVQFMNEEMTKKDGAKRSVDSEKLTQIGFVN